MIDMMQLLQLMQSGGNPMMLLQQMMGNDPRINQATRLMQGKNPEQLRKIAQNMASQRGMSVEQLAQQFGLKLPK